MIRVPRLLPLLLVAAACSGEAPGDADDPVTTVRDSAGVRIVENRLPGGAAPVYAELGDVELEIGTIEGDAAYAFARVVGVATLPGGHVLVAEGGAQELRVFDTDGTYLRSFGGPGGGPGEFSQLTRLARIQDDTVRVWDVQNRRVSIFLTDGEFLGDVPLTSEMSGRVDELTYLPDGDLLAVSTDFPPLGSGSETMRAAHVVRRIDPAGGVDTLAVLPGQEVRVGESSTTTLPDGRTRRVVLMVSPLVYNRGYATVGPDHVYAGFNERYVIERRLLSGELDLVARVPDLDRRLGASEADEIRQLRLDQCENERCRDYVRQSFDGFELPELRPAYSDFQIDATGRLWVAEWEHDTDRVAGWHVFSQDGELLGRVAVPRDLEMHEIGVDYVLGVEENELDVPFVRRYSMTRLR